MFIEKPIASPNPEGVVCENSISATTEIDGISN
jgi:hypothetical protein